MSSPRIYTPQSIAINAQITLDESARIHLIQVLRLRVGSTFILFNGEDEGEYTATLIYVDKKKAIATIVDFTPKKSESLCKIHLIQALAKGDRMDFIVQKSVELGVDQIIPIHTRYSEVKLDEKRTASRLGHWQKVAIHAAEQSERTCVPKIAPIATLESYLQQHPIDKENTLGILLHPYALQNLHQLINQEKNRFITYKKIFLLVGSEGGFSDAEVKLASSYGFHAVNLGQRILRAETAPLVIITLIQYFLGEL